jgi:hypothetical protein
MMVLPGCSSLPNVWLAFLSWALITQWQPRRWAIHDFYCCFVAVASVVSANLTRIGLMGMSQAYYSAIHSPWGNMITNLLILGLIVGICLLDARHETNART